MALVLRLDRSRINMETKEQPKEEQETDIPASSLMIAEEMRNYQQKFRITFEVDLTQDKTGIEIRKIASFAVE